MDPGRQGPVSHRDVLENEALILEELRRRKEAAPLYYYEPTIKGQTDLRRFHHSEARVRILSGGNRSGKTESSVAEMSAFAVGYRPWVLREMGLPVPEKIWERPDNLPEHAICKNCEGFRVYPPLKIVAVTGQSLQKGVMKTLYPKFMKYLHGMIAEDRMTHVGTGEIVLKNGTVIGFGSAEQGTLAFESTDHDFVGIDEPTPRRVYTGLARGGVDHSAPIVMSFTPIGPWANWIFKDLYVRSEPNSRQIEAFHASIFDNQHLSPQAVKEFAEDPALGEMERQARLYGKFTNLAGVIYPTFSEKAHVYKDCWIPRDWVHGVSIDPHQVRPWAIAYFAISPGGDIYFHKEWPPGDFTRIKRDPRSVEDYVQIIRKLDADLPITARIMDPNFGTRTETMRGKMHPSLQSELSRYGLYFNCGVPDDLLYGEGRVREMLAWDQSREPDSLNRPKLFVAESCHNVINALSLYGAKSKVGDDELVIDDVRDETYKDFADVVRYAVVAVCGQGATSSRAWEDILGGQEMKQASAGVCYGEDY